MGRGVELFNQMILGYGLLEVTFPLPFWVCTTPPLEELVREAQSLGIDNAGNFRPSELIFELVCRKVNRGDGIIGCGMIATFHARALAEIRGAKLIGCFDAVSAASERTAAEQGCQAYTNLKDLFADKRIDVVTICTPSGAHMEPAIAAAKAGKHVVVEKPLEITLNRCDDIIRACDKAGVRLCAIFNSRFTEGSQLVKKTIDSGRFGVITTLPANAEQGQYLKYKSWNF